MFTLEIIEIDTDEVLESRIVSAKELQAIRKGYANDNFYKVEYMPL
jgi:hypothetical protein